MSNEIQRVNVQELAWNGKRVRLSKEQLSLALAPIFAAFPGLEMSGETFNAYHMMLCDLDPNKLVIAVMAACQAHKYPTQLVTIAAIREMYESNQVAPGPASPVDADKLPPLRTKFFRLPEDEDRHERMERLRQTRNWDGYYS